MRSAKKKIKTSESCNKTQKNQEAKHLHATQPTHNHTKLRKQPLLHMIIHKKKLAFNPQEPH